MVNSIAGSEGLSTTLVHNAAGRLTRVVTPIGLAADIDYFEEGYRSGRVKSVQGNNGEEYNYLYDDFGRLDEVDWNGSKLSIDYPELGVEVIESESGDVLVKRFGALAQLLEVSLNGELVFNSVYQAGANAERLTLAGGLSRTAFYDVDDKATRFVDPLGSVTQVSLNDAFDLTRITDPLGRSSNYEYDESGNRTARVDALGARVDADYDDNGQVTRLEDRAGKISAYVYDERGKLSERTYGGGLKDEFTYDEHGRLVEARNATGTTTLAYNGTGLIAEVSFPHGRTVSYTYDATGQVIRVEDDSGHVVRYDYDERGALSALLDGDGEVLTEFSVNTLGQLEAESHANGTESTYSYDAQQHLAGISHLKPDASSLASVAYSFDTLNRRTGADFGDVAYSFEYDNLSRLTGFDRNDTAYRFAYDSVGNRLSTDSPGQDSEYGSDALNRYFSAGDRRYEYDANGYMTKQTIGSEVWTYEYDGLNQLIRVTGPGSDVSYQYDALGYRVRETRGGQVSDLVPNPLLQDSLLAIHEGTTSTTFGYGQHGYAWFERGGEGPYFLHYDGSGNVIRVTDTDGEAVNSYEYLPFGEKFSETETIPNRLTFGGRHGILEAPGGQYWIQVRTYDPWMGRFLSPDAAATEGANPYTYGANQPTNFVDYNGYDEQSLLFDNSRTTTLSNTNLASSTGQNLTQAYLKRANGWALQAREIARTNYFANLDQFNTRVASGHANDIRKSGDYLRWAKSRLAYANKNVKSTKEALQSSKNYTKATKFGKFLNGLSTAGTIVTAGNAVETQMRYNNGETTLAENVRGWALLANDGLQKLGPLGAAGSTMNSALDMATRENFVLLSNWWYEPEDPFGPSMRPRDGSDKLNSRVVSSFDPNDKSATGVGDGGYIDGTGPIEYRIRFENVATASAAAQQVRVTDVLDAKLDWSTLELLEFGFNGAVIVPQQGASGYSGVIYIESDPNPIQCEIHLDTITGELTVDFRSFDEITGDWPEDPFAGFLPPNDETGRGEGYIRFSIWPLDGLDEGAVIENQASIVFDVNEPIITNVTINTIDTTAPSSAVAAFPANTPPSFVVNLTGDDGSGSGIAVYEVFVSVNGAPFVSYNFFEENSFVYDGIAGVTYAFYSIATDSLGFEEPAKTTADSSVTPVATGGNFYLDWAADQFGADADNPALEATLWGKQADPDGDGYANILESYLSLNPLLADVSEALQPAATDDQFTVTYTRVKNDLAAAGLRPQISTDALTWTGVGIEEEIIEDLGETVRVRATMARNGNRTMLFRLRAQ